MGERDKANKREEEDEKRRREKRKKKERAIDQDQNLIVYQGLEGVEVEEGTEEGG